MKYFWLALLSSPALATPYPHPAQLIAMRLSTGKQLAAPRSAELAGTPVLRVQVDWKDGESYVLSQQVLESSGTPALLQRSQRKDPFGSYQAQLIVGEKNYFDSIGTGKEYRKLARALSFRFPVPTDRAQFRLWAENPLSGVRELVLDTVVDPSTFTRVAEAPTEGRLLRDSTHPAPIALTLYAEGYTEARREAFFKRAQDLVKTLEGSGMPEQERFRISAVFASSKQTLGGARDLGPTPRPRDSFLGLDFPYWNKFGRWFNVIYPTNEHQLRSGFAQAAYDYPVVLADDRQYWGVGNYRVFTAIPAEASQFSYLFLHEFGHHLGLNEEYEEDGRTELEFAPGIQEPWSANQTFHPHRGELKWEHLVEASTPLPTDAGPWGSNPKVGAYVGGYAGSAPIGVNHKPVLRCTMNAGGAYCPVCREAIQNQLKKEAGE